MSFRPWQSNSPNADELRGVMRDHPSHPAWVASAHDRARELLRQDRAQRNEKRAAKTRVDVEIELRGAATARSRIRDILFRDRELIAAVRPAASSNIPTSQPPACPGELFVPPPSISVRTAVSPREALYADARARLGAVKMRLAAAKARVGLGNFKADE